KSLSVTGPNLGAKVQALEAQSPLKVHNTTTKSQTQVMALRVNSEVPFVAWKDVTKDDIETNLLLLDERTSKLLLDYGQPPTITLLHGKTPAQFEVDVEYVREGAIIQKRYWKPLKRQWRVRAHQMMRMEHKGGVTFATDFYYLKKGVPTLV
ncbi:hypothetical protein TorRG33x02_264080, partial [Trema orientale]